MRGNCDQRQCENREHDTDPHHPRRYGPATGQQDRGRLFNLR